MQNHALRRIYKVGVSAGLERNQKRISTIVTITELEAYPLMALEIWISKAHQYLMSRGTVTAGYIGL
jgi:hypothetical protein